MPALAPLIDQSLIDESVDPQRVSRYWRDFESRHPEHVAELQRNPHRVLWLNVIFSSSRFLSEELLRHPEWLASIHDLDFALSKNDLLERLRASPNDGGSALDLALFRRRELVRIVLRDRLELAPLVEITEEVSNLSDAILACALVPGRN